MKINWRKLNTGNWVGRYKGYYFFIYKRPHGKWCAQITHLPGLIAREGYHATSLKKISVAKEWCKGKLYDYERSSKPCYV